MSSTKIEDSIISAVGILTDRAISKAGFDKTIQAVIKSCEDKAQGKYLVTYQDSTFYAYSTSPDVRYSSNVAVYVLVPSGDFHNTKTILGTVTKLGEDYITAVEEKNSFDIIGQNMYAGAGVGLKSGLGVDIISCKSLVTGYENYLKGAHYLQLQADVRVGETVDQNPQKGDFALEVDIEFIDNDKKAITRTYALNTSKMIGNPFTSIAPVTQSYIFEIDGDNLGAGMITDVRCAARGFDPVTTGTVPVDIFFDNIQINAVEPLEYLNESGLGLSIITKRGTLVTQSDRSNSVTFPVEAVVKSKGVVYSSSKIEYQWFIADGCTAYGDGYSSYAGVGWKNLSSIPAYSIVGGAQSRITIPATEIAAKEVRFLCVAIVDGMAISKKFIFRNTDSVYSLDIVCPNKEFYYDSGTYSLTAQLKNGTVNEAANYSWYSMDSSGFYQIEGNTASISGNVNTILKFKRFFCVATDNTNTILATGEVTITNSLTGGGYSLIITHGDVLFKYNEKGTSPCAASRQNPQIIQPLYFEIYDPDGNLEFDSMVNSIDVFSSLTWLFPNSDTLLKTSFTTTLPDQGGFKVYSKKEKFEYTIDDRYNASKSRNEIQLVLNYKGNALSATTNFTFTKEGGNGTNGTDYSAKIVKDSDWQFSLKTYLNGELKTGIVSSVVWSMLYNKLGGEVSRFTVSSSNTTQATLSAASYDATKKRIDILRAIVKFQNGYEEYVYHPVIQHNYGATAKVEVHGFSEVIYSEAGRDPIYDKDALFYITVNGVDITGVSWSSNGLITTRTSEGNGVRLTMSNVYDGTVNTYLVATKGSNYVKIPIYTGINRYSNSAANAWDGNTVQIDNNGGYVITPQLIAGQKNSDNSFTGIIAGTQKTVDGTTTKTENGLFGYNAGARTIFLDALKGSATFNNANKTCTFDLTPNAGSNTVINITTSVTYKNSNNQDVTTTFNPFQLYANGKLVLSDYKNFKITLDPSKTGATDQIITAGSVFYVRRDGYLYATAGSIGGWNISSNSLSYNNTEDRPTSPGNGSTYNSYTLQLNTNSNRSGNAIAASRTVYTYNSSTKAWSSSTTSCTIGYNGVLTANGANITGTITATAGKIGNWTLASGSLFNDYMCTYSSRHVSTSISGSLSTYITIRGVNGSGTDTSWYQLNSTDVSNAFFLSDSGYAYPYGAYLYYRNSSGTLVRDTNYLIRLPDIGGNSIHSSGKQIIPTARTWKIYVGGNFGVTSTGALFASGANIKGVINATGGSIGGWTIQSNYLSSSISSGNVSTSANFQPGEIYLANIYSNTWKMACLSPNNNKCFISGMDLVIDKNTGSLGASSHSYGDTYMTILNSSIKLHTNSSDYYIDADAFKCLNQSEGLEKLKFWVSDDYITFVNVDNGKSGAIHIW